MKDTVIVYSTPFCTPCEQLKKYLDSRHVSFINIDLMMDEDAAEFLEGRGIRSSPVLQVGDQLLFGTELETDKIDRALGVKS